MSVIENYQVLEEKDRQVGIDSFHCQLNDHADDSPPSEKKIDIKDVGSDSKIRLEWSQINVDAKLPSPSCCKKLKLCCVKEKEEPAKTKNILQNVSGVVEPGSFLAIMGASGSGKTTLLNVLSRQSLQGLQIKGTTLVNNKNIKDKMKTISAYVRQEDLFIGTLTVSEHLRFQALLRMGKQFTDEEKTKRVHDVMSELGLLKCKDTIIGVPGRIRGISGGELKRLSFASEIITNPKLLFVDEPTSGLDSFMAENVILALQRLAREGRTILATIHQPSSYVYQLFDRLLLMSQGRVAYLGSRVDAVGFFERVGNPCPPNFNPSDHYIRCLAILPGQEEECIAKAGVICDQFQEETKAKIKTYDIDEEELGFSAERTYKEGVWSQFRAVLWRATKAFKREPYVNKVKFIQNVVIGLLAGLVYLQQHDDQAGVRNINGAIFFIIINTSFSTVLSGAQVFPTELHVFLKENRIGMYRTDVYFIGRTLAEIPWHLFGLTTMLSIAYWMAGLNTDAVVFFTYIGIMMLMQQVCLSYGYFIASISPSMQVAAAISAPLILPFLLFGGFFVKDDSIPVYFIWLKVFSWMKYAFAACQINQWENFGPISCVNGTAACLRTGLDVLQRNGYDPADLHVNVWALVGLAVGFRLVAFLFILMRAFRSK